MIQQRHCTIQGHNELPVLLRCTYKDCKSPKQWLCVKCNDLHHDHITDCLEINYFSQMIQDDKGKYVFKERKELVHEVGQQFHQLKDLILSSLQKLEQYYEDWVTFLTQKENSIQEEYSRVNELNILALTELDITKLLKLNRQQEVEDFQKNQAEVFNWMKNINVDIKLIGQQIVKFVDLKHGFVKEKFGKYGFTFVGEYKYGIQFGEWSILDHFGKRIGGGSYDQAGKKYGQWIDIDQISTNWNVYYYCQHIGQYNDGTRIDQWVIKDEQGKQIGGGQYNASGSKVGQWLDIEKSDGFYCQHIGQYQDGIRIDQWVIKDKLGKQIGGGQYNASGSKVGQWKDLDVCYGNYYQHIGEYRNGTRIGQWVIEDNQGELLRFEDYKY